MVKNGVLLQSFEWYTNDDGSFYNRLKQQAKNYADLGISAVWMPPSYKGIGGTKDVGYGAYDLYDLGEFNQKGTIRTKYGTKDEYLSCVEELQKQQIDVYADVVLNHKMGADELEMVNVYETENNNREQIISDVKQASVATRFTFENRHNKYSDFKWDYKCFDGVDYDCMARKNAKYLFENKKWDEEVDDENDNFDYLMGADLDFGNEEVVNELIHWGHWYLDFTHVNGFRLDAVKHISASFYHKWVKNMREYTHKDLFVVGEYWHGDLGHLLNYLNKVEWSMSLFDVCLHYRFYDASKQKEKYDLRTIFDYTLVKEAPLNAVTFVDNHDTQPEQGLQSFVEEWFKLSAYALILLREQGYPCVFIGDLEGNESHYMRGMKEQIEKLIKIRKKFALGKQIDYFDDPHLIAWTREEGLVCLINNENKKNKKIYVGEQFKGNIFSCEVGKEKNDVLIDENGFGDFVSDGYGLTVYTKKIMRNSFFKKSVDSCF